MNALALLPPGHWLLEGLLVAAAVIDWRTSRLPNWLTFGGAAAGLLASVLPHGIGIGSSVLGAAAALALLLPLWLLRVTGAGDVKLLAMAGAFLGVPDVFFALLLTMAAGGALALGFAAMRGSLGRMVANTRDLLQVTALAAVHRQRPATGAIASVGKLPYGVCVCLGTSAWLAWRALQA
ncbi:A24 family peptidase [Ramlibacter sp. PS4R-6]|uniref:A24 family peptidase n=1 Tax=Ramlibacter sp. PS4R-6 TaxID=3133438 RepID=UPI0030B2E7D3